MCVEASTYLSSWDSNNLKVLKCYLDNPCETLKDSKGRKGDVLMVGRGIMVSIY